MNVYFIKFVLFIGIIYICGGILLYFLQRNLIYFPTSKINHKYKELTFSNEKNTINVIELNPGKFSALLYFGGNAELVTNNAEHFKNIFPYLTIYLVNYRGYGGSTGTPTEKAIYSDASVIFEHIQNKHQDVIVMGRSLGSGVATYLAENNTIEKIILITPYDSIKNIAQQKIPIYPMTFLLHDKYESYTMVNHKKSKFLVLAAENDAIIPLNNTLNLTNQIPKDKLILNIIKDTDHNNISNSTDYYQAILDFLFEHK